MGKIEYTNTGIENLDEIGPLWLELNDHHRIYSDHFPPSYQTDNFERRKRELLEKSSGGELRIDLAKDKDINELVGYCVSTISKDHIGEVDSIFVEEYCRRMGIGDNLMKRAIAWMREKSVSRIVVEVITGNDDALKFYGRYGFFPRSIVLERTYPVDPANA